VRPERRTVAIRFWYWGEVFCLLKLCDIAHCSWWWVLIFVASDMAAGLGHGETTK
jgi:hypothetical protein